MTALPGGGWLKGRARSLLWRLLDARLGAAGAAMSASPRPALVFAPHQDDESFGCGGLIALKRELGAAVEVVFLTDGGLSYGADRLPPGVQVARRRQEALDALDVLGVARASVRFLDRPDGTLGDLEGRERDVLLGELVAIVDAVAPQEVYVTYRRDGHPDHEAAAALVRAAIGRSGRQPEVFEYPVWSRYDPRVFDFGSPDFASLRRLPIGSARDRKRRAIACHRSQFEPIPPDVRGGLPEGFVARLATGTEYYFVDAVGECEGAGGGDAGPVGRACAR